MKYVYFYNASAQEVPGTLAQYDGLLYLTGHPVTWTAVKAIKTMISESHGGDAEKLTLHTLSFIALTSDSAQPMTNDV